jgi:hypothetical protein
MKRTAASDEKYYEAVVREIEAQGPRKGLWAKAFAEAGGVDSAARAIYFKLRVGQLIEEEKEAAAEREFRRREQEHLRRNEQQMFAERDRQFLEADGAANKRFVIFALVFLAVMFGLVIMFASAVK